MYQGLIIPCFIPHAGCPHTCSFCDQHQIAGTKGGVPSNKVLREHIASWLMHSKRRPVEVAFFGGSFTLLPVAEQGRLLEVAAEFRNEGVHGIRISTRPDAVDDHICKRLHQAGVKTVELGVQSLCDEVLLAANRGHCAEQSIAALRLLASHDFTVGAQLLLGLPGDTFKKALDAVNRVVEAGATLLRLYPVLVLPHTDLYHQMQAGDYQPLHISEAVDWCAALMARTETLGAQVIRVGLHELPSEHGVTRAVVGPWHPAFGDLVHSARMYWLTLQGLQQAAAEPVRIYCHQRSLSSVIGHQGSNRDRLATQGFTVPILARDDQLLDEQSIIVEDRHQTVRYHLADYPYPGGCII